MSCYYCRRAYSLRNIETGDRQMSRTIYGVAGAIYMSNELRNNKE